MVIKNINIKIFKLYNYVENKLSILYIKKLKLNILIKKYFKIRKLKYKFKYLINIILKIKKRKNFFKKFLKKNNKLKINYNYKLNINNKKINYNNIIYFLKYYLLLKKRIFNSIRLSKIKISNFTKYNRKTQRYLKYNVFKLINKNNLNLFNYRVLSTKKLKKHYKQDKLYDIKKKYIRYFINNRLLYSFYNRQNKIKYKFFRNQFKYISPLNIKERINYFELSLKNFIIKMKYSYSIKTSQIFLKSGFLFINGIQSLNLNQTLIKNDYIELIYSNIIFKLKKKLKKKIFKNIWIYKKFVFRKYKNFEKDFKSKNKLFFISRIFIYFKNNLYNIIQYDLRTQSFIIIKNLNIKKNISYINKKYIPIYYLKLLNWKIIS